MHLYCYHKLSKLSTTMYPREYRYEQTCSSQFSQQREKVAVLHCVPLVHVYNWMDDEFDISMDAVVHGKLVVYHAALMQNACCPESNLRRRQPSNLLAVQF